MKKLICLVMLLLVLPFSCQAHDVMGYMPERTKAFTKAVERYFWDNYNLKLKNKVKIIVTENSEQYEHIVRILNFNKAKIISYDAAAVTDGERILINGDQLMDRHFWFILAHELVHKYQIENWKDVTSDYVMLEGLADVIASDISMYEIDIKDHGIPYEDLKSERGYFENLSKDTNDTLEQIRYYAKHSPGFMVRVDKSKINNS